MAGGVLDELTGTGKTPMGAVLEEGTTDLTYNQVITFTRYTRQVLPADGFIFWVKSSLLVSPPTPLTLDVRGSLHYATNNYQLEDENFSLNSVVFTALDEVEELNDVEDGTLWLASVDAIRFAFSARKPFFRQSGLYHYSGDAVYPAMASQIIDALPIPAGLIVTNSLPIWMGLQSTLTTALGMVVEVYPSYLVPSNIQPPYVTIHVIPESTQALAAAPRLALVGGGLGDGFTVGVTPIGSGDYLQDQLCSDRVRVTLYGFNNAQALQFMSVVNEQSLDYDIFGVMNIPTARDEKRQQNEMSVIAQKKTIEYVVSYYQSWAYSTARKLIEQCIPSITVAP